MTHVPEGCRPHVREVRPEDLLHVIDNMRPEDVDEVTALGQTPEQAILRGVELSDPVWTVVDSSGTPVAIFGAVPAVLPGNVQVGIVWLLGTSGITDIRWEFLRQSRRWLKELHKKHKVLFNRVDARNKTHIEWLMWLKFRLMRLRPEGVNGELFYQFIRISDDV